MRIPILLTVLALVAVSQSAAAQEGITIKTGSGAGRAAVVIMASNSGDAPSYLTIEFLVLTGGERVTPRAKPELRVDGRSPTKGWSWGVSNPADAGMSIADVERAATALVRIKGGRGGNTECKTRVPATYRAASKKLEISLGDTKRFFDAEGRALLQSLCNNENISG